MDSQNKRVVQDVTPIFLFLGILFSSMIIYSVFPSRAAVDATSSSVSFNFPLFIIENTWKLFFGFYLNEVCSAPHALYFGCCNQ